MESRSLTSWLAMLVACESVIWFPSGTATGNARCLRVGTAIRIPSLPADADKLADATPARTSPSASPGATNTPGKGAGGNRTYVVRPGDSFYKIAERELGKASRWKELLAINKSLVDGDPTRLRVGQKVTLPES